MLAQQFTAQSDRGQPHRIFRIKESWTTKGKVTCGEAVWHCGVLIAETNGFHQRDLGSLWIERSFINGVTLMSSFGRESDFVCAEALIKRHIQMILFSSCKSMHILEFWYMKV